METNTFSSPKGRQINTSYATQYAREGEAILGWTISQGHRVKLLQTLMNPLHFLKEVDGRFPKLTVGNIKYMKGEICGVFWELLFIHAPIQFRYLTFSVFSFLFFFLKTKNGKYENNKRQFSFFCCHLSVTKST